MKRASFFQKSMISLQVSMWITRLSASIAAAAVFCLVPLQAGAGTPSRTYTAVADTHVSAAEPTRNFSSATQLRVAGDPVVRTYLKFNVGRLSGKVAKATLRVYAKNESTAGFDVRGVLSSTWSARTLTFSNAPAVSKKSRGRSGPFPGRKWFSIDVTALVRGPGVVSIALLPGNEYAAFDLGSVEARSLAPRLQIESSSGAAAAA
jgi:hypothetical protein